MCLKLRDLAAQRLGRLGVLRRLGNLGLEGGNLLVVFRDLLLVVGGLYLRLALLLRRVLRTLRGFLAAIGLTVHAVPPFVSWGGHRRTMPAPLPVRASSNCVTK